MFNKKNICLICNKEIKKSDFSYIENIKFNNKKENKYLIHKNCYIDLRIAELNLKIKK